MNNDFTALEMEGLNDRRGELSIDQLDAVTAGNIFGDAWRLIKGEPTVKVDYVAAARTLYHIGRSIIRWFW